MSSEPHPASSIVGRDAFIAEIWDRLRFKSLYMNDLRRIGKTRILQKMHAEVPEGWITSFSDLEGTHTAEEFATLVYRDSAVVITRRQQNLRKMGDWLGKVAGAEIGARIIGTLKFPTGKSIPWKDVLRTAFADIANALKQAGAGHRMVFFWDEVPFMLENIAKSQGKDTAMQVLDILRELSQRHENIRLVLTGSIGIHHVLRSLWGEGYKGSPLNHMDHIQPGPLSPEHAVPFAESGMARRGLLCGAPDACAAAVSEAVGHIPFYIEKLVNLLPRGESLTPGAIHAVLERELGSATSGWDLEYYQRRVGPVFGDRKELVLTVLDIIAVSGAGALAFHEIRSLVNARMVAEEEALRDLLKLLCMDHYLVRDDAGAYRFYLPLVHRWWKISRSL